MNRSLSIFALNKLEEVECVLLPLYNKCIVNINVPEVSEYQEKEQER